MADQPERAWIAFVNDHAVDLTAWELGFMESITEQFERTGHLSDRQLDILERLYQDTSE